MTEIILKIPNQLSQTIHNLIENGWYLDENEIILLALRNFLNTHSEEIMTEFIKEDIEWGLNGEE
ncbi:MAG: CopG family transcriptional regulator [Leptospiraceae bacterium]|nr:CopG family transcriptional regulator [Leptospiraceae bacterium]